MGKKIKMGKKSNVQLKATITKRCNARLIIDKNKKMGKKKKKGKKVMCSKATITRRCNATLKYYSKKMGKNKMGEKIKMILNKHKVLKMLCVGLV